MNAASLLALGTICRCDSELITSEKALAEAEKIPEEPLFGQTIDMIPFCDADFHLADGETKRCRLRDTVHIQIDGDPLFSRKLFKFHGGKIGTEITSLGDIWRFGHELLTSLRKSIYKSKIHILCDSPDELDYFYGNNEVCRVESTDGFLSFSALHFYRRRFIESVTEYSRIVEVPKKNFHCSLDASSMDLKLNNELTVRRRIPGRENGVIIMVRYQSYFDFETLSLIAGFIALSYLGPWVLCNSVSRVLICILLGSVFALALVSFFIVRDIGKTTLGKIGVATAVFFGSVGVISEGIVSTFIPWVITTVKHDKSLQIGSIATGIAVIGAFRFFNIEAYIMFLSYGMLRILQIILIAFALTSNPALCVACVVTPIISCSLLYFARYIMTKNNGVARDSFPAYVYREAPTITPRACRTLSGTPDEKMRKYELEGTIQTRKCLEMLGEDIRANVSVVTRTNDPNTIAHWAGVTS